MKIELFHTPIYKVKVDLSKIQIESGPYIKSFKSRTPSTISTENKLSSYSRKYLLEIFKQYLPFKNMSILNIWKNKYLSGDYQETHIHAQSNFSFIIYEKIKECKTVFRINWRRFKQRRSCSNAPKGCKFVDRTVDNAKI